MSIYNTDRWLREAVDSVIGQDIGFEKNVQIIFVNDGSPDNSEEICLEYRDKYPNNIIYVKKSNGGLSSARNYGLRYRDGEYINFFDPDDVLELNVLKEVYKFAQKHAQDDLALITIPLVYFEAQEGLHKKYEFMGDKNRVIRLLDEPYNFVLSSAGSFYKSEVFEYAKYDPNVHTAEDTDVNFRLYLKRPKIGYVTEKGVKYNYRKRATGGSMVDSIANDTRGLTTVLKVLKELIRLSGESNFEFINQCIIYELRTRVRLLDRSLFNSSKAYGQVLDDYRSLMSDLPRGSILSSRYLHSNQLKYIFLSRIGKNPAIKMSDTGSLILSDGFDTGIHVKPILKAIDIVDGAVIADVLVFNYGIERLELTCRNKDTGESIRPIHDLTTSTEHDVKLGNQSISETRHMRFKIPLGVAAYEFAWTGEDVLPANGISVRLNIFQYLSFKLNTKRAAFIKSGFGVSIDNKTMYIYIASTLSFYVHALLTALYIARRHKRVPLTRLLARFTKRYVLINDRPLIARDNGEAVFRYISSHEPDLSKHTYYVLDSKSEDYSRLSEIGNVVKKNSLKHRFLFINSKLVMSSHLYPDFILPFKREEYKYFGDLMRHKFVWLQHGITKNDISDVANKFHQGVDALVVATKIEKDIFTQDKYLYNSEDILTTGFPRFDYNIPKTGKVISVMPTWRKYLASSIRTDGLHEKMSGFEDTEFFNKYARLLSDTVLQSSLTKAGVTLNFILHPGLMGQASSFYRFETDNVKVLTPDETNYQKIFSESALLVTDYSSVFFDFAYLRKPTLFYQFDEERFFSEHYSKSEYFDYRKNGTGQVFAKHKDIVDSIIAAIDSGFAVPDKYMRRVDKLFLYHDQSNSKRLVEELRSRDYI